jgi:hypothetical protein
VSLECCGADGFPAIQPLIFLFADIQMSDWTPRESGSKLLKRHFSYIKPLNGGIGPKQTKCEISDEIDHMDPDKFISVITTTRTPDVPSGNVFSVKTRTCLVWGSARTTKVLVTTKVEWTGRSFIKGRSYVVTFRRAQLTPAYSLHPQVSSKSQR